MCDESCSDPSPEAVKSKILSEPRASSRVDGLQIELFWQGNDENVPVN